MSGATGSAHGQHRPLIPPVDSLAQNDIDPNLVADTKIMSQAIQKRLQAIMKELSKAALAAYEAELDKHLLEIEDILRGSDKDEMDWQSERSALTYVYVDGTPSPFSAPNGLSM